MTRTSILSVIPTLESGPGSQRLRSPNCVPGADRRSPGARQRLPVRPAGGISRPIRELPGRTGAEQERNARRLFRRLSRTDGRTALIFVRQPTPGRSFRETVFPGKGPTPSNPCLGMPYSAHSHYCFQESAEAEPATRAKGFFGRPGETDRRPEGTGFRSGNRRRDIPHETL